jgi:hypothetical protein
MYIGMTGQDNETHFIEHYAMKTPMNTHFIEHYANENSDEGFQ